MPTPPSIFLNKILIPAPTPINQRGACGGKKAGIKRQVTNPPSLILSSLASITHKLILQIYRAKVINKPGSFQ